MAKYEVGQTVYIIGVNDRGQPPFKTVVEKVGRKLVHVKGSWGGPMSFDMEGGFESGNYSHHHIYTEAELANKQARDALMGEWVKIFGYRVPASLTGDQMRRILDIAQEPA